MITVAARSSERLALAYVHIAEPVDMAVVMRCAAILTRRFGNARVIPRVIPRVGALTVIADRRKTVFRRVTLAKMLLTRLAFSNAVNA